MRPHNVWQSYRTIATQTASPGQLVLMLLEGALRFLQHARTGFEKDDPADALGTISNNIIRAQQIIRELDLCLNMDQGGQLARELRRLYDYFDARLQQSNLRKEVAGIDEVIERLGTLRDAWSGMLSNQHSQSIETQKPLESMAA